MEGCIYFATPRVYDGFAAMKSFQMAAPRILAAIFVLALVHASLCTAACATTLCAGSHERNGDHTCGHRGTTESRGPGHSSSAPSNCLPHTRPSAFVSNGTSVPQVQVRSGRSTAGVTDFAPLLAADCVLAKTASASSLTPHPAVRGPSSLPTSVLRI
jgi:hypothetical protein